MADNEPVTIKQLRSRLALPTRNPQRIRGIIRDMLNIIERLETKLETYVNRESCDKKEPEQCLKTKPELPVGTKNSWKSAKPLPSGQRVSPVKSEPSLSETTPSSPPGTTGHQETSPIAENLEASIK